MAEYAGSRLVDFPLQVAIAAPVRHQTVHALEFGLQRPPTLHRKEDGLLPRNHVLPHKVTDQRETLRGADVLTLQRPPAETCDLAPTSLPLHLHSARCESNRPIRSRHLFQAFRYVLIRTDSEGCAGAANSADF